MNNDNHNGTNRPKRLPPHGWGYAVFMFVFVVCAIGVCAGLSFMLWRSVLYKEASFLTTALSAMTGFMIFGSIVMLVNFSLRKGKKKQLSQEHTNLLDAIQEISRGNFDVLIKPDPHAPHQEIADAFNKMTQDLGSLEAMRQDFISNVSHEIQSPLTSINGFAALLQKSDLPKDERQRYAAIIETESKRLSSLSDNLLKLSSLDNNKISLFMQEFRLDKQLKHVALTLEPQWSVKKLTVEAELQKLAVNGDQDLLSQVWMNLLHNAIKFTPERGQIKLSLSSDREATVVKISDTGIGIAQEEQMHIFERFYKVDKARNRSLGGNGLGLSIVKKIVELHKGSITAESEIGKGTVFTIRLPKENFK